MPHRCRNARLHEARPCLSRAHQIPPRSRRIETLVASFALCRLGATQNPIIQIYREREVGFALQQMQSDLVLVPGTWRNFDYVKMVEDITADWPRKPQVLVAYETLPEGDPATLPPVPSSATVRFTGWPPSLLPFSAR